MADDYTIFPERKTETVQDEGPVNNLVTTTTDTVTGTTETTTTMTEPTIDLTPEANTTATMETTTTQTGTIDLTSTTTYTTTEPVTPSTPGIFTPIRQREKHVEEGYKNQYSRRPEGSKNPKAPTVYTSSPTKIDDHVLTPRNHFNGIFPADPNYRWSPHSLFSKVFDENANYGYSSIQRYNILGQTQYEYAAHYTYLKTVGDHSIRDYSHSPFENTTANKFVDDVLIKPSDTGDVNIKIYPVPKFSGAMTLVNPYDDKEKQDIMDRGLGEVVDDEAKEDENGGSNAVAPVSPLSPFTRVDNPNIARYATIASYNRTHIPVADVEVRNTHRHIFISRPECYICCVGGGLSDQCMHDMDFASMYARMPYILELLSPCYVTKSFTSDGLKNSNWNFLLSNRIISMDNVNMQLNTIKGSASYQGATTMIPTYANIYEPGTLNLTFRETKNLEVGEMLRMWMLYISNRHRGIFSPPYNGYQKVNGFVSPAKADTDVRTPILHPYDRAIEFPCTIFDIITNESDTRILNMVTYLGAHPINLTRPLTNENNGAITNINITASFQYQGRIENTNASYAHFNYNSGIINAIGGLAENVTQESLSFLLKDSNRIRPEVLNMLGDYAGPAGMFTGSPYIVVGATQRNPVPGSGNGSAFMYTPYLKFMPLNVDVLNKQMNMGINSIITQKSGTIVALDAVAETQPTLDPAVAMAAELALNSDASGTITPSSIINGTQKSVKEDIVTRGERIMEEADDSVRYAFNNLVDSITGTAGALKSADQDIKSLGELDDVEESDGIGSRLLKTAAGAVGHVINPVGSLISETKKLF